MDHILPSTVRCGVQSEIPSTMSEIHSMIAMILARIYNYCRLDHDSPNHSQQNTMGSSTPSTFCYDELRRALSEQSFGIQSYTMTAATPQSASATVFLLEGQRVVISLENRGYFVSLTLLVVLLKLHLFGFPG